MLFAATLDACAEGFTGHSTIADKEPRDFLNRDLLVMPDKEQQAWIHGAMSQTVTVLASSNPEFSACLSEWYFGSGKGEEVLSAGVERYPEMATNALIWAVAQRACPPG